VAQAGGGRSRAVTSLLVGGVVAALVVVVGLFVLINKPIGSQVEMDGDLDESYCQMVPEDCR
jgi:hypothetical protein